MSPSVDRSASEIVADVGKVVESRGADAAVALLEGWFPSMEAFREAARVELDAARRTKG